MRQTSILDITPTGGLLLRRPVHPDVAKGVVLSADRNDPWATMLALEECMDPRKWLDTALWCAGRFPVLTRVALDAIMRNRIHFTAMKLPPDLRDWWHKSGPHLTLWRGCYEGANEEGPAFCPDPFYASLYARLAVPGEPRPVLIEATVPKEDCVAFAVQRRRCTVLAMPGTVKVVQKYELPLRDDFYRARALELLQ